MKKIMAIGILCFSMMALLQTQAIAGYGFASVGFYWNTYTIEDIIHGGTNPAEWESTFVANTAAIGSASLVCKTPGGDFDVRGGKGGITVAPKPTKLEASMMDQNGKFDVKQHLCGTTDDCELDEFKNTWGVSEGDCRNRNWQPFEYLIKDLKLTGQILTNCDPNLPPSIDTCDLSPKEMIKYCETPADPRTVWPNDGTVYYVCVTYGDPIAIDDNYSVRAGRTLSVRAPGVLSNDHDTDAGEALSTAVLTQDLTEGDLVLYDEVIVNNTDDTTTTTFNGGFEYTPPPGFLGLVSFKYRATDSQGNTGNEATVTITVK